MRIAIVALVLLVAGCAPSRIFNPTQPHPHGPYEGL